MVEGSHLLTDSSSIPSSAPALEEEKPTYMLSYMTRLLLFQKVESNGGLFLKVVLECKKGVIKLFQYPTRY